jgi:hypothetical protein
MKRGSLMERILMGVVHMLAGPTERPKTKPDILGSSNWQNTTPVPIASISRPTGNARDRDGGKPAGNPHPA